MLNLISNMESNMEGYLWSNAASLDLGLSLNLNTLHPQANCHPVHQSSQAMHMDYEIGSIVGYKSYNDPTNRPYVHIQNKAQCAYIKVNLDGVAVGRKTCLVYHATYSSLALQLEHMFGGLTAHGLRLFQYGSEFNLFYKDRRDNWRFVGDAPWEEFVDCAKRLRIVRKNNALLS